MANHTCRKGNCYSNFSLKPPSFPKSTIAYFDVCFTLEKAQNKALVALKEPF